MNKELLNAIAYLSKEKGVSADVICDSLEAVLITAYKKEPDANPTAEVELNRSTGDYAIKAAKTVVDEVEDPHTEISLDKARLIDVNYEVGDVVNVEALLAKGILSKCEYGFKVLGNGKVTKKVTVEASAFSASAKEAIEAAGGKAEVV